MHWRTHLCLKASENISCLPRLRISLFKILLRFSTLFISQLAHPGQSFALRSFLCPSLDRLTVRTNVECVEGPLGLLLFLQSQVRSTFAEEENQRRGVSKSASMIVTGSVMKRNQAGVMACPLQTGRDRTGKAERLFRRTFRARQPARLDSFCLLAMISWKLDFPTS